MTAIKNESKKRLKVPQTEQAVAQDTVMIETGNQNRRKLSLSDLPWDTVNIVFDFTPSAALKQFRLNKTFTRLVNKRRVGLTFRDKQILPETFGQILKNNQRTLKELYVLAPMARLRTTIFESFQFSPKCLRVLDIKKLEMISEKSMQRMLMASGHTLQTLKMSYRNPNTFSRGAMLQLAQCKQLTNVEFASLYEHIQNVPGGNLANLKLFLYRKVCRLQSLKLYECDKEVLEILKDGPEA